MTFAIRVRAFDGVFWPPVFSMHLAFMSQETSRVRESRQALAPWDDTSIRAFVLVHVLATNVVSRVLWTGAFGMYLLPLATSVKRLDFFFAVLNCAVELSVCRFWYLGSVRLRQVLHPSR